MPEPWTYERARSFFDYEAQPKEEPTCCDACGTFAYVSMVEARGQDWCDLLADRDRYGFPVPTVQCCTCGLIQQRPRLAPAGLRALYSGPYRALVSAWHGRPINRETLEPEQAEYGRKLADSIRWHGMPHCEACHAEASWCPEHDGCPGCSDFGRILDLGGSTGVVAQVVGKAIGGQERLTTLVEPYIQEAVAAAMRVGRVVVQSAEDFEAEPGSYDLILLCQAVDHLRSISTVLRKVRTWLAPGGRFFVDAVDSERIPEPERYKIDHIYSLTPATMRAYLERAGFVAWEVPAPSENHVAFLCEVAS